MAELKQSQYIKQLECRVEGLETLLSTVTRTLERISSDLWHSGLEVKSADEEDIDFRYKHPAEDLDLCVLACKAILKNKLEDNEVV